MTLLHCNCRGQLPMEPCPSKDSQAPMDADAEDPGQAASGSSSGSSSSGSSSSDSSSSSNSSAGGIRIMLHLDNMHQILNVPLVLGALPWIMLPSCPRSFCSLATCCLPPCQHTHVQYPSRKIPRNLGWACPPSESLQHRF